MFLASDAPMVSNLAHMARLFLLVNRISGSEICIRCSDREAVTYIHRLDAGLHPLVPPPQKLDVGDL